MDIDLGIALAGLIVGFVVGLTGMGGGALMTPILVIGFGIEPLAAVSSDLVAAVVMKPIGGGIHFRRGTVHTGLVRWLMLGSVPGALLGSYLIAHLGDDVGDNIKVILGVVLLVAAAAMIVRSYISRNRTGTLEGEAARQVPVRRVRDAAGRALRWDRRGDDVGRFRFADDRRDDAAVPDVVVEGARRH